MLQGASQLLTGFEAGLTVITVNWHYNVYVYAQAPLQSSIVYACVKFKCVRTCVHIHVHA